MVYIKNHGKPHDTITVPFFVKPITKHLPDSSEGTTNDQTAEDRKIM